MGALGSVGRTCLGYVVVWGNGILCESRLGGVPGNEGIGGLRLGRTRVWFAVWGSMPC